MEAIPDNRSRLATTGKIVKGPLGPADHVRRDEGCALTRAVLRMLGGSAGAVPFAGRRAGRFRRHFLEAHPIWLCRLGEPAPIGRWVATTGKIVKGPLGPADHVRRDEGCALKSDKKT
jgi:hypothetical protein